MCSITLAYLVLVHDGVCAISSIDDFLLRAKAISWIFATRKKNNNKRRYYRLEFDKKSLYFDECECEMQEDGECETNDGLAFSGRFSRKSIFKP